MKKDRPTENGRYSNFALDLYWTLFFKETEKDEWIPYLKNDKDEERRYFSREDVNRAAMSLLSGEDGCSCVCAILIRRSRPNKQRWNRRN